MWGCGRPHRGACHTCSAWDFPPDPGSLAFRCLYSSQSRFLSQEPLSGDRPRISHVPPPTAAQALHGVCLGTLRAGQRDPRECGWPLMFAKRQDFNAGQARSPGSGGLALRPGCAPASSPSGQAQGCSCPPAAPALSWALRMPIRCPEPWAVTDPSHTHPGERNKLGVGPMAPVPYAALPSVLFKTKGTPTSLGSYCSSLGL